MRLSRPPWPDACGPSSPCGGLFGCLRVDAPCGELVATYRRTAGASHVHGGEAATLLVRRRLSELKPNPDDDDLAWVQSRQYVTPSVPKTSSGTRRNRPRTAKLLPTPAGPVPMRRALRQARDRAGTELRRRPSPSSTGSTSSGWPSPTGRSPRTTAARRNGETLAEAFEPLVRPAA